MEKWRLDGEDYTSVGDYVKDLEQKYFKINNDYHTYKTRYERILEMVSLLVSEAQEYFKEETEK